MHVSRVHIDDHTFVLTAGQDIPALKASIVEALLAGGGFVDFLSVGRGLVSVLITPHLLLRFDTVERSEDQTSGGDWRSGGEDSSDFDIDDFAEQFGP